MLNIDGHIPAYGVNTGQRLSAVAVAAVSRGVKKTTIGKRELVKFPNLAIGAWNLEYQRRYV
jgi:hypothetical protein